MESFTPNMTRTELLKVLDGMDISIPANTKLPNNALEKRLKQAIKASQSMASVISKIPLPLAELPKWPTNSDEHTVFRAIRRGDFREATMNIEGRLRGEDPFPLRVNPVIDVRQTLMTLAKNWDRGSKFAIMQDIQTETCAINIRIVDVYKLRDDTPLLLVLFLPITKANPWPGINWAREVQSKQRDASSLRNIDASELEQKLLLQILTINSTMLPREFNPTRMASEVDFKLSFLLPVGPLSFEDRGKLNLDVTGCVVCGSKTSSRCSGCQSASYCGSECQKRDWKEHKKVCRTLKEGSWRTIPISNTLPELEGLPKGYEQFNINRFNFSSRGEQRSDPSEPPSNIHGDKLFLIKLQIGVGIRPGSGNYLIYDRQRSFQAYFLESKDHVTWHKFREEMQSARGGYEGRKMYRWAKRTGDWTLSVCLDKEPQEEIKW